VCARARVYVFDVCIVCFYVWVCVGVCVHCVRVWACVCIVCTCVWACVREHVCVCGRVPGHVCGHVCEFLGVRSRGHEGLS
jgi:hypothetical protein